MKRILTGHLLLVLALAVMAEEAYITQKLNIGLHEDKFLESPIIKVVPTGTRLDIIKREDRLTFVRDSSGASGWINNDYLSSTPPANSLSGPLQERTENLEKRVAELREEKLALEQQLAKKNANLPASAKELAELKVTLAKLEQDFKAEKLKSGQLQVELTELRKRVGQDSDVDSLYEQINSLQEEKLTLEVQLARTLEKYGESAPGTAFSSATQGRLSPDTRNMLIYLLITLALGIVGGAYFVDFLNRRRHGGFRI